MSIFKDEKYENMDWLSQATEPYESEVNFLIALLPAEYSLTGSDIMNLYKRQSQKTIQGRSLLEVERVVDYLLKDRFRKEMSWIEREALMDSFKLVLSGSPELDLETEELTNGTIVLIKERPILEDDHAKRLLMQSVNIEEIRMITPDKLARANEILDLLTITAGKERMSKSMSLKHRFIQHHVMESINKDEWRVRNDLLMNKICKWINTYIETGAIAALVNLTKFKILTHSGNAIYSLKEEVL